MDVALGEVAVSFGSARVIGTTEVDEVQECALGESYCLLVAAFLGVVLTQSGVELFEERVPLPIELGGSVDQTVNARLAAVEVVLPQLPPQGCQLQFTTEASWRQGQFVEAEMGELWVGRMDEGGQVLLESILQLTPQPFR